MPMKIQRSFGLTTRRSMTSDGRDKVVTAIMKERTTPSNAPFPSRAYAMGIVPKMSAYIGMPTTVATITPSGLVPPNVRMTTSSGIQL